MDPQSKGNQVKKVKRIEGFNVEILESVQGGRVWFLARIVDPPIASAKATSREEAYSALELKWESVKKAYRQSNLPIPIPPRGRGNKRILETLRMLASRPFPTSAL